MIQKLYIPNDARLRQLVNFMSYVEITTGDQFEGFTAIFPNATSNLMFSLDQHPVNQSASQGSLYTSCASTIAFSPYIGMKFMSVQFNSYGLSYFNPIPAEEYYDSMIDPTLFFKASELNRISDRLKNGNSIYGNFLTLESFLVQKVSVSSIDQRLPHIISSLKAPIPLSIDALSKSIGITNRGFQKMFKKHVGMPPSEFRKIVRFNRAAQLILSKPELSLSQIAFECGYFDQSHFIKDFKKFGGIVPSLFLDVKAESSDFYNYNLKEIGILNN